MSGFQGGTVAEAALALGAIAGGSQLMGAGMQAVGQMQKADAYGKAAAVEADAQEAQGRIAQFEGFEQGKTTRYQGRYLLGEQQTITSASGLRADTGSALEVARESARQVELDALKSEFGGLQTNYVARRQAQLTRYGAKLARREATMGAVGSIIQGVGGAASTAISLGMGK